MPSYNLKNVPYFPTKHVPIVPSDTATFQWPTVVFCTQAIASITVKDEDGNPVTYTNVPAWASIPCTASAVMATGTTGGAAAVGLVGIYGEI